MRQRIISILIVVMLIAGLSLLLYPAVSNYIHTVRHRRAVFQYVSDVETINDETYEQILAAAQEYNSRLADNPIPFMDMTGEQLAEYESLLDVDGTGIMGYVVIEKADISLPVYHGAEEAVLQVGAGHIPGSSLPVGGESTHALLSGHRGLPSAKLFTNLDILEKGDTFVLNVLSETYVYQVDDIQVVEPAEVQSLKIVKGKDYCTLITCTPYGINSHRLLVRGKRVPLSDAEGKMTIQSGARIVNIWYLIVVAEVPALLITVFVSAQIRRRRLSKTTNSEVSE